MHANYPKPLGHRSLAYAVYASNYDPLLVMANTRKVPSASPAITKLRQDAYRAARDRSRARSYLVDRKPRDWLDAGIIVIAKSQVMK
jgi:hypothetical protein